MIILATLLLIVGLVATIVAFFYRKNSQKQALWWGKVQETNASKISSLPNQTPVVVKGLVGFENQTNEPLQNTPCVWWSYTQTEHWQEQERNAEGDFSHWTNKSATRSSQTSNAPFLLKDQTGISRVVLGNNHNLEVPFEVGQVLETRESLGGNDNGLNIGFGSVSIGKLGGSFGRENRRDAYIMHRVHFLPLGLQVSVSGLSGSDGIYPDQDNGIKITQEDWRGLAKKHLEKAQKAKLVILAGLLAFVIGLGILVLG